MRTCGDKMNTVDTPKRKTDKRTINTKTAIKKTLLEMMRDMPFSRISVKELCERINVNRTTFYIHYGNTMDVLTELIDEVLAMEVDNADHVCKSSNEKDGLCPYRLCDKVHKNRQLGVVFFDDSLKPVVIDRISEFCKTGYVRKLMTDKDLNKSDAESIFYFQINGCLAVNKMVFQRGSGNWEHTSDLIAQFISGGLDHFKRK